MARRYSQEVHDFITANVTGHTTQELVSLVNDSFDLDFTESTMKSYKTNHKLRSGTQVGRPKGHHSKKFPKEIAEYITINYRGCGPAEMTERLNREFLRSYTVSQLKGFYANHRICSGITGYFPGGHVPFNKGRKGVCAPGCEKTQFRKGNLPANTKPIGYERVTRDGYIEVKVAMRPTRLDCNDNFVAKHRIVWEEINGTLPPGNVLVFRDGNRLNCELSNIRMVTRAENCELNRRNLRSKDPDFTDTGILIAKVNTTAARKIKEHKSDPI